MRRSLSHLTHEEKRIDRQRYNKEWREAAKAADPNFVRRGNLSRFGLSFEDFTEMVKSQNGECAICDNPPTRKRHDGSDPILEVDHDYRFGHRKGRRLLLCTQCNTALGLFKESIISLENAIAYLEYFNGVFEGKGEVNG